VQGTSVKNVACVACVVNALHEDKLTVVFRDKMPTLLALLCVLPANSETKGFVHE
jgi:sorbitol-specific phosphotransferase system component IIA